MDMKKQMPVFFIALWMLLLVSLGGYYLLFAPRESTYSPEENRNLAAFPEANAQNLFSGKFAQEFETYLLDRFPGRNSAIHAVNRVQNLLSFADYEDYLRIAGAAEDPLDKEDYLGGIDDLLEDLTSTTPPVTQPEATQPEATQPEATQPEATPPETTASAENPPIQPKPAANLENFPQKQGLYMNAGYGENEMLSYSRKNVAAVTAVVNKLADLLPENGKVMFTVVPSGYIVNKYVTGYKKGNFYNTWDSVINALSRDNVYAFDSARIMAEAIKEGAYVSFRTDMHWTPYGTYLVYSQMAARAGKTPCSYEEDFDITLEEPFRGTDYRDHPAAYMDVQPDTLALLMPKTALEFRRITGVDQYEVVDFLDFNAKKNDRYTVYLGGPGGPWRYVESDNGETENCLVVMDSFGLGAIPFLTQNYKQVHCYDPRYFDRETVGYTVAEMIAKYEIQDIYIIVGDIHSFDSGFLIRQVNEQLGISG